ncbi:hypothetical protein NIES4071_76100 [Calothrix sp. NIES-4071]|nr:hypothetical protein NIES4071_76100 [Calothrix sp. NIES-4071]BAZ61885.1 hypothetical protein NIES4105_76050 [Calothrix sp. NIES-4105]
MSTGKIPDEALVVRGGRNRPEDIERGIGTHPSGVTGISVESAPLIIYSRIVKNNPSWANWCDNGGRNSLLRW